MRFNQINNMSININKKLFLKVSGIIFICWLILKIVLGYKESFEALEKSLPITYSLPSEFLNLFSNKTIGKVKVIGVNNSKERSSIPIILFDSKYHILMYKIDLSNECSIQNLFKIQNKRSDFSLGHVYLNTTKDLIYQFNYKAEKVKAVNQIILTLSGDSLLQSVKNDSILNFHLECKNLSIKYEENDPIDIMISGNKNIFGITKTFPADFLFLKRRKNIYIFIMTPIDIKSKIPTGLLYNVVNGN